MRSAREFEQSRMIIVFVYLSRYKAENLCIYLLVILLTCLGFRFGMYRGEHVDILYGNVKHAFFQARNLFHFIHFSPFSSKVISN